MAVDNTLEEMMNMLGDFGSYQGLQFLLHILSALTAGMHMLSLVTVAAVPNHRCFIDSVDTNESFALWNTTGIMSAIPQNAKGMLESCSMFGADNSTTVPCESYVYDTTYYQSSRSMEWGFVCDKRWLGLLAQTIFMLGVFTGALFLGGLADKIGRKTVFCWSAMLQLVLGTGVAFIPEYYTFLVVRFLYGIFGSAGSYITGFVLTMELVGPSKRTPCGIAFQAAFAFGIMLVAGWGALIHDRMWLQVCYGLHGLLFVTHWWTMDESPRWLWMQGRHSEAVDIVAKGVEKNGRGIKLDKEYFLTKAKGSKKVEAKVETAGMADLFKTPNLRKMTLNVCLCWFANSIVYYGLSLGSGDLEGNPFVNLCLVGLVEMPSYIATILLMDRLGRRFLTSFLMLGGGICCIIAANIAAGSTAATAIVMIGKLFIAGSFAVIYNYSAELFPTVVRNSAMGLGSMCARASGALTPLIVLFLRSLDERFPAILFGVIAIISGFLVMFLPETNNQTMPQSIEDGENFGVGDTLFTTCLGPKKSSNEPVMVQLENMKS